MLLYLCDSLALFKAVTILAFMLSQFYQGGLCDIEHNNIYSKLFWVGRSIGFGLLSIRKLMRASEQKSARKRCFTPEQFSL
jgi:hypothetical protein